MACTAPAEPSPSRVTISPIEATGLAADPGVVFVDARTRVEFVAGHLAGAINVPPSDREAFGHALPALRAARIIVSYCAAAAECSCADDLAGQLTAAGMRDVRILEGGIQAWLEAGYAAEAGGCSL
ncbi:MAG: rhodanese-like domain-containing protein [Deltaproteobacteria bacterium]|nr:rhodanese-like domain-containing protein [Deltaproteobacteria bacterium]